MDLPRIAEPCHEPWDGMTPAGSGRHCAACDLTVVDLSAMPRAEARAWLQRQNRDGGRACVRAPRGTDGRIALPPPARARLLTNALAAMLAMAAAGCTAGPASGNHHGTPAEDATTSAHAATAKPSGPTATADELDAGTCEPVVEGPMTLSDPVPAGSPMPDPIEAAVPAGAGPKAEPMLMGEMPAQPDPVHMLGRIRLEPTPPAEPAAPHGNT